MTLGGQVFPVKGPVRGNAIVEFETGIKVGKVSYDQREHAFFLVLDDFSGGFGHRRLDIRDQLGTYWTHDLTNAPDLRRPGHITLGPKKETKVLQTPPVKPLYGSNPVPPQSPSTPLQGATYFGMGNAIYFYAGVGTPQMVATLPANASSLDMITMAQFFNADLDQLKSWTWFATIANVINGNGLGGAESGGLFKGLAGGSWVQLKPNNGFDEMKDCFTWDEKLLIVGGDIERLLFAVITPPPDDTNPGGTFGSAAPSGPTGDIQGTGSFTGSGISTSAAIDTDKYGMTFNIDVEADHEVLGIVPHFGTPHFIGVASAPWGEPAVHMYIPNHSSDLYVLDFYSRKVYPIEMGGGHTLRYACMYNGVIVSTDGWNIYEYNPASSTVRNIGFPRESSIPNNFNATYGILEITRLTPGEGFLWASCQRTVLVGNVYHIRSYLFCYNGVGWTQVGQETADMFVRGCFSSRAFESLNFNSAANHQMVEFGMTSTGTALATIYQLPPRHNVPTVGIDLFGPSGANFETGWIDGGFNDIYGSLLRLNIDAFSLTASETVKIEYRLDNDETAAWVQMVDATNNPAQFTNTNRVLYFSQSHPKRGIRFRTVQFRISLYRGTNETLSPEIRALTLVFLKTPELRTSWAFEIDINHMIEVSASGEDDTYYVDGNPATMENVWAKLRTLWINQNTLLEFIIPNVHDGDNSIDVRISDMPITIDDFRDAVLGKGTIQMQVIQPVI